MSVVNGTIHDTKPSLLRPEHEAALLRYLYDRYVTNFGRLRSNLGAVEVYTTERPESISINLSSGGVWYPIPELAKSLESKGLIAFNENRTAFHLTGLGFIHANKSFLDKLLDSFNKNPVVISILSLIVSIVAVVVSIWQK